MSRVQNIAVLNKESSTSTDELKAASVVKAFNSFNNISINLSIHKNCNKAYANRQTTYKTNHQ